MRMEGNDAVVVLQVRAGDTDAFRVLVERHSHKVFRLAYRMTSNEQDAEDVVQETFLLAYRRLEQFESRSSFSTWIHRIAINCALDLMRARRRHDDDRVSEEDTERPNLLESLPAPDPLPDRLALSAETRRRVQHTLSRLSPAERTAFVLRHFEGMSIDEIAETLGVRANAAKNSVFRAVRKLRQALEPLVSSACQGCPCVEPEEQGTK